MSSLVCGRCGQLTAPNSTYCPRCRWTLFVDVPEGSTRIGASIAALEAPRGVGGMLARRRLERNRAQLERDIRSLVDRRIEALEEQLKDDAGNRDGQRALGAWSMLENNWQRANAHLSRAHEIDPRDFETHINLAIVCAQRGQLQPALTLLQEARALWPGTPIVLLNLALVALQARRAPLVIEACDELEALWEENPDIATDFHDDTLTARGLALLLLGRASEARAALEAAARHTTDLPPTPQPPPVDAHGDYPVEALPGNVERHEIGSFHESLAAESESNASVEVNASPMSTHAATSDNDSRRQERRVASADESWPHLERRQEQRRGIFSRQDAEAARDDESDDVLALSGNRADADLLNNLALAEAEQGDLERAIARLAAAMRLEPGNARVYANLGVLAYQQNNLPGAFRYLDLARQIEDFMEQPEAMTHNHLGVVLSAMGKLEESWEEFGRAGGHERAEFEVWYNVGRANIEAGRADKGVEFLKRAFQFNPQHADVHAVLGAAYLLRGGERMLGEALNSLKRALQFSPRHRAALCDLTMTLIEMENFQGAAMVAGQALKIFPRNGEVMFLRSLLTLDEDDENHLARAATQFNTALGERSDLVVCLYNTALCQYVIGLRDAAAQQFEGVTRRDMAFAPAYFMMGAGHAVANRYPEALAAWQKASHYEPGNPDLQANMGYIYYQRGDWPNAIACYLHAHRSAPGDAEILSCLGLAYGRQAGTMRDVIEAQAAKRAKSLLNQPSAASKEREAEETRHYMDILNKAIAAFEQSLRFKPHTPSTHSNMGLALYFQKQVEKAVDQWRLVSRLDARYAQSREEDQYRNFDESGVTLRPLNWRARVVKMAPLLPLPHTRLVPGYNARAFRPALPDPEMQKVRSWRQELETTLRLLGWLNARK